MDSKKPEQLSINFPKFQDEQEEKESLEDCSQEQVDELVEICFLLDDDFDTDSDGNFIDVDNESKPMEEVTMRIFLEPCNGKEDILIFLNQQGQQR